jgi:CDGSH-type Zn-finger protein
MPDGVAPRIRVMKDGPYMVDGVLPLAKQLIVVDEDGESIAWQQGEVLPERHSCALCRCGESAAKPYCDGSHRTVGFDGTETAPHTSYADVATPIEGPDLVLLDQKELCADARFCAAKGRIWRRVPEGDAESRAVVIEQAELCPAGRYTAVDRATGRVHEPDLEPSIGIVEDPSKGVSGPLWVRGGVPVVSAAGEAYEVRNRVTLCRCGGSKNKPFCDSAHIEIGFDDAE